MGLRATTSPPFNGIPKSGTYFVGYGKGEIAERARLELRTELGATSALLASAAVVVTALPGGGAALAATLSLVSGGLFGVALFDLWVPEDDYRLEIRAVPAEGMAWPATQAYVHIKPDAIQSVRAVVIPPATAVAAPSDPPLITAARLDWSTNTPRLIIEGQRFTYAGSQIKDVEVDFSLPYGVIGLHPEPGSSTASQLVIDLTQPDARGITLGLAEITVTRTDKVGSTWVFKQSDPIRLQEVPRNRVLSAVEGGIVVMDSTNHSLIARIPLGDETEISPRSIAVTPDGTRAYVTLRSVAGGSDPPGVAVIDMLTLQPVDTDLSTAGVIDWIDLPGVSPFGIAIDPRGQYAYISDYVVRDGSGHIWTIQIGASAESYHAVKGVDMGTAPAGLRGLAVSADGRRLYVAAPRSSPMADPYATVRGEIKVLDIDPSSPTWRKKGWIIPDVGGEPFGITASSDPTRIVFTNRSDDPRGFCVLQANTAQTAWKVECTPLDLGLGLPDYDKRLAYDTFDVNNGQAIALTSDNKYAFVTGYNAYLPNAGDSHNPTSDPLRPAGSSVGIIINPLDGTKAQLVAATRPIPLGSADNLVIMPALKPDPADPTKQVVDPSKYGTLYVVYTGANGVFVYDIDAMLNIVQSTNRDVLARGPVNDLPLVDGEPLPNAAIDVRADYRLYEIGGVSKFGVPPDSTRGPIGAGGLPRGLGATRPFTLPALPTLSLPSRLYVRNSDEHFLFLPNPAAAGQSNLVYEFVVDGPYQKFMTGISNGMRRTVPPASLPLPLRIRMKALDPKEFLNDQLYAVHIRVFAWWEDVPATRTEVGRFSLCAFWESSIRPATRTKPIS